MSGTTDKPDDSRTGILHELHASGGAAAHRQVTSGELRDMVRAIVAQQPSGIPPQSLRPLAEDDVEALTFYPWRRLCDSRAPVDVRDLILAPEAQFARRSCRILLGRPANEVEIGRAAGLPHWRRVLWLARLLASSAALHTNVTLRGDGYFRLLAIALEIPRKLSAACRRGQRHS